MRTRVKCRRGVGVKEPLLNQVCVVWSDQERWVLWRWRWWCTNEATTWCNLTTFLVKLALYLLWSRLVLLGSWLLKTISKGLALLLLLTYPGHIHL